MKLRTALALILALAALAASAETHYKAHVSVGAHGGMALSRVSFSPSVPQRWASGATAGVSVRYAEEKLVGIVAELNLTQRGWSENYDVNEVKSPLRYTRTASYLALPVMTHINFGSSRCRAFFNLGPEIAYMLSQSTSANYDYTNPTAAAGWPDRERMTQQLTMPIHNRFDYGICAGAGVEYWVAPRHSIYLEGRFYYGLGNIYPAAKADVFSASRNMTIAVTLGYNFRIK